MQTIACLKSVPHADYGFCEVRLVAGKCLPVGLIILVNHVHRTQTVYGQNQIIIIHGHAMIIILQYIMLMI